MYQQLTTTDAIKLFLLNSQSKGLIANTIADYNNKLQQFVAVVNIAHLKDITPSHIRSYFITLQQRSLTGHSIHSHARVLRAFFNYCKSDGLFDANPFDNVAIPKVKSIRPKVLSNNEIVSILTHCKGHRDRLIVMLALDTGIRANELARLTWADIQENKVSVISGKGNKDRLTFIGKKTQLLVMKYFIECGKPKSHKPVFNLTLSGVMQFYKRLSKRSGISVTSHTIRRTTLTMMLKSGMSLFHLKEIAGHNDIKTLQHYINVDDDLADSHSKFGVVDNL